MEILPGVQVITDAIDATTLTMTLIGESQGLIVDTGLPASLTKVVLPYLEGIGRTPTWIQTIVNTHCHSDHVGGNHALVELAASRVLIHRREARFLADPMSFVAEQGARYGDDRLSPPPDPDEVRRLYGPGTPPDAELEEGDLIGVDGREWRVIHTPGHSPGGICLYEAVTGTLITGDAIQAEGTTSCDLAFYFEAADYARSLRTIAGLEVETIIAGHPFKPFPTAILTGPDARRFLEVSRAAYERYREQVVEILKATRGAPSTTEVAAALTRANGFTRCVGSAIQTTRAHLEQFRAEGRVMRVYTEGSWHWRLGPTG